MSNPKISLADGQEIVAELLIEYIRAQILEADASYLVDELVASLELVIDDDTRDLLIELLNTATAEVTFTWPAA